MDYTELKEAMKEVKSEMTSAERMKKYFAEEEVDHIPYSILADPLTLCIVNINETNPTPMSDDIEFYTEWQLGWKDIDFISIINQINKKNS